MIISSSNTILAAFIAGGSCGPGDRVCETDPGIGAKEVGQLASVTLADTSFSGASAAAFAFEATPIGPRTLGETVRLFVDSSKTLILQGADSSRTVFVPDITLALTGRAFASPGSAASMLGLVNYPRLAKQGRPGSSTPTQQGWDLSMETKYDLMSLDSPGEPTRYFMIVRLGQLPNTLIAEVAPIGAEKLTAENAHGRIRVIALNSAAE